uniref:Glycoside hydrolase 35 catalytic domain-containing protein n=1 Tax=Panagrolaimus superbus TaxID=310955 RepID=A0A914YB24_9BILA
MYNLNASFSFYMFHGGTNFGFWNGAEVAGPVITSYDYGAPISEDGGITPQYLAIQEWIRKLPNWDTPPLATPKNNTAKNYGEVTVQKFDTLLESFTKNPAPNCHQSILPLSFEAIDHPYGFVLYRKVLEFDGSNLTAENIKDHGFVYINDKAQVYCILF